VGLALKFDVSLLEVGGTMSASDARWDIRCKGRRWTGQEAIPRYELTPEKIEMVDGKLFWSDEDRITMLGLLLENVGVDAAVRLGDPQVWRDAVAALGKASNSAK